MIDLNDDNEDIRDAPKRSIEGNGSVDIGKRQRVEPGGSDDIMEKNDPYLKLRRKFPEIEASMAAEIAGIDFLKPAFDCLLAISKNDISEGDPYLLVLPDVSDSNSMGYMNGGNYGLSPGAPGYIPWPGNYSELFCVFCLPSHVAYTSQGEHLLLPEHRCPLV